MGQLSLVAAVLAVLGTLMFHSTSRATVNANATEAAAIAGNMMVYRNYVSAYASAHPTATGTTTDASLGLPPWYQRIAGVNHYLSGGIGYVYFSATRPGLTYQILKATDNAITVGIKASGALINPLSTTNSSVPITLPSAIADGSVVYAF